VGVSWRKTFSSLFLPAAVMMESIGTSETSVNFNHTKTLLKGANYEAPSFVIFSIAFHTLSFYIQILSSEMYY
jgi:hypothetical protein